MGLACAGASAAAATRQRGCVVCLQHGRTAWSMVCVVLEPLTRDTRDCRPVLRNCYCPLSACALQSAVRGIRKFVLRFSDALHMYPQ